MNDLEAEKLKMSNTIDKLEQELKTEIGEVKENLNDVQEKNFAFKYRVGSGTGAVKQYEIVKFDTQVYGTGVEDGVFTAPIAYLIIYKFHR